MINRSKISKVNTYLERLNPAEILYWLTTSKIGRVTMTSSFQAQSLPLLYFASKICPFVPILFLDTGYHFKETLSYIETLRKELDLNIKIVKPKTLAHADKLYRTNPDMCCYLCKVEPLQEELKKYDVWISGIRRDQTSFRKQVPIMSYDKRNEVMKLCPMANVARENIEKMCDYLKLPMNPLQVQGYLSVGCEPCTKRTRGNDERSGRWGESEKTECGLHLPGDITKMQKLRSNL